ncbi:MAG: BatA domain-containing protein [Candidatus Nanohaloarchaea archaeon]
MVLNQLSHYFLNPVGLAALLGILPVIVFYLVKPKPEEVMMPPLRFFQEQRESGRIRSALEKILKNLMLLFHLFVVALIAVAIANPFVMAEETPENAVLVLDRSASMKPGFQQAKNFIRQNLGQKNTLVVVDNDVQVALENVAPSQVREYLAGLEAVDTETDIVSGLKTAQGYRGSMVVASDLDQTTTSGKAEPLLTSISAQRPVEVMHVSHQNSWGIVGVEPGKTSSIKVKNFGETTAQVDVTVQDVTKTVSIGSGAVTAVSFRTGPGKNIVTLEDDGFRPDNTAYISIPPANQFEVFVISDTGNRYFAKAAELINFTSVEVEQPPISSLPEADVYVVGNAPNVLPKTLSSVEEKVRNGKSAIVFAQETVFSEMDSLPVRKTGGRRKVSVEFQEPRRINVGQTSVFQVNLTRGDSLSQPDGALVHASLGKGEMVFYNIENQDFRADFLYPVFWKEIYSQLLGRQDVETLNVETGETIQASRIETPAGETRSGTVEVQRSGFYNTSSGVYAANMESPSESSLDDTSAELEDAAEGKTRKGLRTRLSGVLLLLLLTEMLYLYRTGDIR